MSQDFITRLLSTPQLRLQTDCMICLEKYNTMNTATGIVEWEVRLPCGHRVGSSCIVIWLRENNSCPACRRRFFPAQPRPYLEHGIMDGDDSLIASLAAAPVSVVSGRFDAPRIVSMVAESIFLLLRQHLQTREVRPIKAVSIYMASYLMHGPSSLEQMSRVSGLDTGRIRSLYVQNYPHRLRFLDAGVLEYIADGHTEGLIAYLPLPAEDGNGGNDHGEGRHEARFRQVSDRMIREEALHICNRHCGQLGSPWVRPIARAIVREPLLGIHLGLRSPPLKAAVGLYMAAHLLGVGVPPRRIAELVGVNEGNFNRVYARVYPVRERLVKGGMFEYVGLENLPRAIEALPVLSWPPL